VNAAPPKDAALWETVPECGVCRSTEWRSAGEVCGRRFAACSSCGMVRLYDRVAENRLHLLYAGYYSGADPSPAELDGQLANPTFAHRRGRLEASVDAGRRRMFEIGCGDGNFLAFLRRAGWAVGGSEFDARTAEMVRRRHGIRLFTGDVTGEDAPEGAPFPVISAYHVLEHVYHPVPWLRAVRRLLAAGGVLHLQVPNHASLTRRLTGAAWASLMFPQHVYFYTPRTLAELLRREGFAVESATTWDPWHGPGTVAGSALNAVDRLRTGRIPWTDVLPGGGAEDGAIAPDRGSPLSAVPVHPSAQNAMPARRARLARRVVDALAVPVARAEAAAGLGAVVDVVARVA
jgi:SAM-dependent methyltransferase